MNVYSYTIADIKIVSRLQNTTVCINDKAEINCGYTGADPNTVVPTLNITLRSDNGSIISNNTVDGLTIFNKSRNGLQWVPDLTSGDNNATNSKLLVGPVNKTHNQSSYQCIFTTLNGSITSSVGTMTVVGKINIMTIVTLEKLL